jgi:phage tail-like protein
MPSIGVNTVFQAAKAALGVRMDPYRAFRFHVEIDGLLAGGFTEISGLSLQTEVETVREGGLNEFEHKLPKGTKQTDITLKHGLIDIDLIWDWYRDVVNGTIERKSGSIYLLDETGVPAVCWDFYDAFPIKWDGPTLNAASNTVATETLVIAHHGIDKSKAIQVLSALRGAVSAAASFSASGSIHL